MTTQECPECDLRIMALHEVRARIRPREPRAAPTNGEMVSTMSSYESRRALDVLDQLMAACDA